MKRILLSGVLFLFCYSIQAQSLSPEVVASAGNYFTGASSTLEWTIGEIAIETYSTAGNVLTQGFHQTNLIITSTRDEIGNGYIITAYPNPASEYVDLLVESKDQSTTTLNAKLWSTRGKLIAEPILQTGPSPTRIKLSDLAKGVYFLSIQDESGQILKHIKIIKQY